MPLETQTGVEVFSSSSIYPRETDPVPTVEKAGQFDYKQHPLSTFTTPTIIVTCASCINNKNATIRILPSEMERPVIFWDIQQ
jgi:hypothetical protein